MDIAIEILIGAVVGFVGVWWTHYAFASRAIKEAGLRLTRTFDAMFLTVPFFGLGTPLWLNGRLPDALERLGVSPTIAVVVSMLVIVATPFLFYRLAALLPGVVANRIAIAEVDGSWKSAPGFMTFVTGIPAGAVK